MDLSPTLAAPVAFAALGLSLLWNRKVRGFLPDDVPGKGRKQHARRTPLAGIALVPVLLFWLVLDERYTLAAATLLVAGLGFVDDWYKEQSRDFDWRPKAVVLFAAAAAVSAVRFSPLTEPLSFLLAVALVFVLVNAINFLDNTDGVACAVASATLIGASAGQGAFAATGFAACGFLPFNWPKPLCFLGDSGAYALGLCTGALCLESAPSIAALVPFAVPLFDFVQVVLVRVCLRLKPWRGDRRHITHILQNAGLPRWLVAPVLAGIAWWCTRL